MATSNDDRISSTKLATFATKLWTKLKSTFAAVSHIHAASDITSGTFADERIASASTWNAKQDALTFDTAPAEESTNPVTSGGVYTALELKQDAIDHRGRLYDIDIAGNATTAGTATDYSATGGIATALESKANDSEVVHLDGAETVTGTKTFSAPNTYFGGRINSDKEGESDVTGYQFSNGSKAFKLLVNSSNLRFVEATGKTSSPTSETAIIYSVGTGDETAYHFGGKSDSSATADVASSLSDWGYYKRRYYVSFVPNNYALCINIPWNVGTFGSSAIVYASYGGYPFIVVVGWSKSASSAVDDVHAQVIACNNAANNAYVPKIYVDQTENVTQHICLVWTGSTTLRSTTEISCANASSVTVTSDISASTAIQGTPVDDPSANVKVESGSAGSAIGSATVPVYVNSAGNVQPCSGAVLVTSYCKTPNIPYKSSVKIYRGSTSVTTYHTVSGSNMNYVYITFYTSSSGTSKATSNNIVQKLKLSRTGTVGVLTGEIIPYTNDYYVCDSSGGFKISTAYQVSVTLDSSIGLSDASGSCAVPYTGSSNVFISVIGNVLSFAISETFASLSKGTSYWFSIPLQFTSSIS